MESASFPPTGWAPSYSDTGSRSRYSFPTFAFKMHNRPLTFPEYSSVRVLKLRHADRWTEGGAPSVGDEGTVVGAGERDGGVWYTVEHAPRGRTRWIAEFSEDELERIGDRGASKRSRPIEKKPSGRLALATLLSGGLGGMLAVALLHAFVPEGEWIFALALGVVFGLGGGFTGGNLGEAIVFVMILSGMTALLLANLTSTLALTVVVSVCSGLGVGQLTMSIFKEFVDPPPP